LEPWAAIRRDETRSRVCPNDNLLFYKQKVPTRILRTTPVSVVISLTLFAFVFGLVDKPGEENKKRNSLSN
jgi:hypothetical protein